MTLDLEPLEPRILLDGASGYLLQVLASFSGTDGTMPQGGLLVDGGGNLYGTATSGGATGDGTVFELAAGSSAITVLASFDGTNGDGPQGSLIMDSSGNLYGLTVDGGANDNGTVFELAAGSGTVTALASFHWTTQAYPYGGLVMDGSGNLYGTASYGGPDGAGTVFEVAAGSNTIATLAAFNGTNGTAPSAGLIMDAGGNLYGTTTSGGTHDLGTVFQLAAGSSSVTALASFDGTNGANPMAGLIMDESGNLYGTTNGGGAYGKGAVFEVAAGGNTITILASFNGTNGMFPYGGLVMDGGGNLYGTTNGGGAYGKGTVFEVAAGSNTITTLISFNGTNGANPFGPLTMDASGNLYGTTSRGGADDDGTVFGLFPQVGSFASPNGHVLVSVYDVVGPLDVSMLDISVKWGKGDTVGSISLGGAQAMEGLGLAISGSSSVGSIKDGRKGALGDLAFVASDAPIKSLQLKSGMTGGNLNGLELGGLVMPQDIDGDGDVVDATAIYSEGALGKASFSGDIAGDVRILGADLKKGLSFGSFSSKTGGFEGGFRALASGGTLKLGGDFVGNLSVDGSLKAFQVAGGNFEGRLLVNGSLGKFSVAAGKTTGGGRYCGGSIVSVWGTLKSVAVGLCDPDNGGNPFAIHAMAYGKVSVGEWKIGLEDMPFNQVDFWVDWLTR